MISLRLFEHVHFTAAGVGTGATGAGASRSSTSTSQPLDIGIPVPSVYCPIRWHVGGPYGTKIIPVGSLPSMHLNVASPHRDRRSTVLPFGTPISRISWAFMCIVDTVAL